MTEQSQPGRLPPTLEQLAQRLDRRDAALKTLLADLKGNLYAYECAIQALLEAAPDRPALRAALERIRSRVFEVAKDDADGRREFFAAEAKLDYLLTMLAD